MNEQDKYVGLVTVSLAVLIAFVLSGGTLFSVGGGPISVTVTSIDHFNGSIRGETKDIWAATMNLDGGGEQLYGALQKQLKSGDKVSKKIDFETSIGDALCVYDTSYEFRQKSPVKKINVRWTKTNNFEYANHDLSQECSNEAGTPVELAKNRLWGKIACWKREAKSSRLRRLDSTKDESGLYPEITVKVKPEGKEEEAVTVTREARTAMDPSNKLKVRWTGSLPKCSDGPDNNYYYLKVNGENRLVQKKAYEGREVNGEMKYGWLQMNKDYEDAIERYKYDEDALNSYKQGYNRRAEDALGSPDIVPDETGFDQGKGPEFKRPETEKGRVKFHMSKLVTEGEASYSPTLNLKMQGVGWLGVKFLQPNFEIQSIDPSSIRIGTRETDTTLQLKIKNKGAEGGNGQITLEDCQSFSIGSPTTGFVEPESTKKVPIEVSGSCPTKEVQETCTIRVEPTSGFTKERQADEKSLPAKCIPRKTCTRGHTPGESYCSISGKNKLYCNEAGVEEKTECNYGCSSGQCNNKLPSCGNGKEDEGENCTIGTQGYCPQDLDCGPGKCPPSNEIWDEEEGTCCIDENKNWACDYKEGGLPIWAYGAIGVGVLAAIYFILRRKKK